MVFLATPLYLKKNLNFAQVYIFEVSLAEFFLLYTQVKMI